MTFSLIIAIIIIFCVVCDVYLIGEVCRLEARVKEIKSRIKATTGFDVDK